MEKILQNTNHSLMHDILSTIERIAPSDLSVVIVGEHGTGKEWVAHAIHRLSGYAKGPFCVVDCAALSIENMEKELFGHETLTQSGVSIKLGAFEEASGGTLLLDEISSLPPAIQIRIARVIETRNVRRIDGDEDRPVNIRVIATLSQQPESLLREDRLRKELYYRISPIIVSLPPLRQRREDIPLLIETILADLRGNLGSSVRGISQEALNLCVEYAWPGNVRHLKNAIEYASVMCVGGVILPQHLPDYLHENQRTQ